MQLEIERRADANMAKALGKSQAVGWLKERAAECDRAAKGHRALAQEYRRRARLLQKMKQEARV